MGQTGQNLYHSQLPGTDSTGGLEGAYCSLELHGCNSTPLSTLPAVGDSGGLDNELKDVSIVVRNPQMARDKEHRLLFPRT